MKKKNMNFRFCVLGLALAVSAGGCAPALFTASANGDLAAVKDLLDKGENPKATSSGQTALHQAVLSSQVAVAKLLIERGADVNARNRAGETPLHNAAYRGNTEMVKLLLDNGANPEVNRLGSSYPTALSLAEWKGHKMTADLIRSYIASNIGLTSGGERNASEYGPIVGALLKGYEGEGKTIAVAGFSYVDGNSSSDGDIVAARVTTELIKTKKLKVVERKEIEKVLGELNMQNTGAMDQASARKLGKMLGADLLVVGTMTDLPAGKVELNARLVEVESGVAIGAVSGQVERNWK